MAEPAQSPDYIAAFQSRTPDQQKLLLGRMSPEQKSALYGEIQTRLQAQKPAPPPNSVIGGAARRVGDIVSGTASTFGSPAQTPGEQVAEDIPVPGALPIYRMGKGAVDAARQGFQQAGEQWRGANAVTSDPMTRHLMQARAITTGMGAANPLTAGTVTNLNRLEDQGRGREASGQAIPDIIALLAGRKAPEAAERVTRPNVPPTPYETAKNLAVDIGPRTAAASAKEAPGLTEALQNQRQALADAALQARTPIRGYQDLANLAESVRNSARFKLYDEGLAKAAGVKVNIGGPAAEFKLPSTGRPLGANPTVAQVDEALNAANAQANAAYESSPTASANAAHAKAVADYLRPVANREIARVAGSTPEAIGALREQVGQLRTITEAARGNEFHYRAGERGIKDPTVPTTMGSIAHDIASRSVQAFRGSPEVRANRQLGRSFGQYVEGVESTPPPSPPAPSTTSATAPSGRVYGEARAPRALPGPPNIEGKLAQVNRDLASAPKNSSAARTLRAQKTQLEKMIKDRSTK
jgi:hypothetical protein